MKKILFALALLIPATLSAQGFPYRNQVIATGGFPFPTIRVCTEPAVGTPCTPLATIFSDPGLTIPLPNPFTGDWQGIFVFYGTPTGVTYHVQVSGSGLVPFDIPNISLGGGTGVVTGTTGQIVVTGTQVGLANPLVFPGPVSGSSGAFSTLSGNFCVLGTTSCLVVGVAVTNPCCTTPEGALWVLDPSLHGFGHLTMYDGSGYDTYLTNNDNPCDMAYGCTGVPGLGVGVALANTPIFVTPYIDAATGKSFSFSSTTGNWLSIQQGTVTPFCQSATSAGVIQECFGSDSRMQLSEGTGDQAYHDVAQTVASGTAAMTTALIASGACGTTVTATATNVATTDTIDTARNAAATNANGGQLIMNAWPTSGNVNFNYCNPGAGNVTPGAATINWKVIR